MTSVVTSPLKASPALTHSGWVYTRIKFVENNLIFSGRYLIQLGERPVVPRACYPPWRSFQRAGHTAWSSKKRTPVWKPHFRHACFLAACIDKPGSSWPQPLGQIEPRRSSTRALRLRVNIAISSHPPLGEGRRQRSSRSLERSYK